MKGVGEVFLSAGPHRGRSAAAHACLTRLAVLAAPWDVENLAAYLQQEAGGWWMPLG